MALEYNTIRDELIIPEYGRNVQKMIAHMKAIESRDERTAAANSIVSVMALLNPQLKEQSDYKHKLWDHLFMIAGADLDIEAPYEKPDLEVIKTRPQKPAYASNHIKYRYYGKNVERMIAYGMTMEDGPVKDDFLNALASYMKMAYRIWNEEKVPDEVIINHLKQMSNGKLVINHINDLPAHNEPVSSGGGGGGGRSGKSGKRKGPKKNFRKN